MGILKSRSLWTVSVCGMGQLGPADTQCWATVGLAREGAEHGQTWRDKPGAREHQQDVFRAVRLTPKCILTESWVLIYQWDLGLMEDTRKQWESAGGVGWNRVMTLAWAVCTLDVNLELTAGVQSRTCLPSSLPCILFPDTWHLADLVLESHPLRLSFPHPHTKSSPFWSLLLLH